MPVVEEAPVEQFAAEQRAGRGADDDLVFNSGLGTPLNPRNVAVRGIEAAAR